MNTIIASTKAVGPLMEVTIDVEGIPILATVDTGAQSTILSRSAFHEVARHIRKTGQDVPTLELPTVKLYGKDGQKGGKELCITAQVSLCITQSVTVPVFIQPDSEQPCLLGMNSLLPLGVQVDGKPLLKLRQSKAEEKMLKVNLVSALTLPCQKGRIVEAKLIDCDVKHNYAG